MTQVSEATVKIQSALAARQLTFDLAGLVDGATLLGTSAFAGAVIQHMSNS